ncbi:carbohydrate kinase family protein [Breznakiella homolactica]|uniref:Carbohydrate kinase family protein n=1 Tax=Breznakiella homolactica TaxID=2798577 RepID=A0A7T7XNE1_9SPIR|nr:carbohydrate kinase family protein [Breznakiella homolactica]QQO09550.1 carbohydrate kinase family protein [Breznakiella homolactica]
MAKKIVSAGLLCLDIMPVFKEGPRKEIQELLSPGKLIEIDNADIHTGGSVANSGLAFQYFGADVTLMGKIGRDYFGTLVEKILAGYGIHEGLIVSPDCGTSYSVVLSPPGIDRIFLHYPGASNFFDYSDIDFGKVEGADLFHFGYPTVMQRLYGNNGSELIRIFREVKDLGILTSLDMAAIDPSSDAAKPDWRVILKDLIQYVDFFVPSVEELCFMLDRERHAEWLDRSKGKDVTLVLDLEQDIKPLADQLIDWGAKIVLIKCGAPGMYLRTADAGTLTALGPQYEPWAGTDVFEASYQEERYCSGTGAGDVSLAAFLMAAIEGYSPQRCLQLAAGAGACCVASYDALSGLMSFEEMIKKIEAGWKKRPAAVNR